MTKRDRKGAYATKKERMAADPEYAAKIRDEWRRANANRYANETPEEKEQRRQRNREQAAKSYQKRKAAQELLPKIEKPKPAPKAPPISQRPKPGRLMALAGWHRF